MTSPLAKRLASMMLVRPKASEMGPRKSSARPSVMVVADTLSAVSAGETWKTWPSRGSSGCVQYSAAKVTSPARKSATVVRR